MGLVQINKIPAWHQSTEYLTSCPALYVESAIKGNRMPGGLESARGNEVHSTGAAYISHCAEEGVASDLAAFDRLAAGAGPQAARILSGMRDSFEVDYSHLLATELTLSVDSGFRPTRAVEAIRGSVSDSLEEPMVVGTLDALYSFPDERRMQIVDLKTHPRPFNPDDTLQGKTYAMMVFLHYPWAEKITFRLVFVRYRRLVREAEFTRDQLPSLIEAVSAARARQEKLHRDHEAGVQPEAVAGAHCWYCPLLRNRGCPIAAYNENMQLTPEQRLNFKLFYEQFSRANNAALKNYVQERGKPVTLKDYNGKAYVYGPQEKESESYPVFSFTTDGMELRDGVNPRLPIIDLLFDYAHDNAEDSSWMRMLTISSSGLKRYLKTNKRAFLDQAITDSADKFSKISLRVSKPLDAVPEEEEFDDEEFDDEI